MKEAGMDGVMWVAATLGLIEMLGVMKIGF